MSELSTGRKVGFTLGLLALLWLLVEGACAMGLWALARFKNLEYRPATVAALEDKSEGILEAHLDEPNTYIVYDRELGWTVRPNASKSFYRANAAGIRADREYAPEPPAGVVRLAAFGDSFTHASDVPNDSTWEARLEALDPRLEVLNYGVPGFGPDQALLRYRREGARFHPQVVLLGYMSENISRVVNTFRPFYFPRSGMPFAKPRFELDGGNLVLVPNPVPALADYRQVLDHPQEWLPRLGEHDWFYQRDSARPRFDFLPSVRFVTVIGNQYFHQPFVVGGVYNPANEGFKVSVALFDAFVAEAIARGEVPICVLFPDRPDLRARHEGRPILYAPLRQELAARGYRVIDLLDSLGSRPAEEKVMRIHYNKEGNRLVAEQVRAYLQAQGLDTPEGVARALAALRARR
ncbi:MAG: SGNH/GDSL hydrolase family protein [Acidobacteriota bacterium]